MIDVTYWKEIKNHSIKLDPRMLLESGVVISTKCLLRGESPRIASPKKRMVLYDRSYIITRVIQILNPLVHISEENFRELMEEVYCSLYNSSKRNEANQSQ